MVTSGLVTLVAMIFALQYVATSRRPQTRKPSKQVEGAKVDAPSDMTPNVQRQAAIASGKPVDHAGKVVLVQDDSFDLNKTIFGTLDSTVARALTKSRLAVKLFWSDDAVTDIHAAYKLIPSTPKIDRTILEFMAEDCNFAMEHADGSFMDHLNFCHDYSAIHFQKHSPRVLFLHSIMGVGTNYFPMEVEKVPKLKTLLTEFEFKHIEAFPSVLRLLTERAFLRDLSQNLGRIDKLETLTFYRVIDNQKLTFDATSLWIQLNYQVMHLIDFLPAACWKVWLSEPLFSLFVELLDFLIKANKLSCTVNFDAPAGVSVEGQPLTLGSVVYRMLPQAIGAKIATKAIRRFSATIGHSLEYNIQWSA